MGTYNNMLGPLRLHQTRYEVDASCEGVLATYRSRSSADSRMHHLPPCVKEALSKESFGAHPAFQYSDGGGGRPICSATSCYGPEGYIRDVWAARDYRGAVQELMEAGWIDDMTRSVAVRLQLGNPQTGCLTIADITFMFEKSGYVNSKLVIKSACAGMGMAFRTRDELWRGEIIPISAMHPFFITTYCFLGLYAQRLLMVIIEVIRRVARKPPAASKYKYRRGRAGATRWDAFVQQFTVALVLDFWLLVAMLFLFGYRIALSLIAANVSDDLLGQRRAAIEELGLMSTINDAVAELKEQGTPLASSGLSHLYASAGYGCVWDPGELTTINGTIPFDLPVRFVDFSEVTEIQTAINGTHTIILFVMMLKCFRYLQVYKPLVTRFQTWSHFSCCSRTS
jgi:hypothetical protein